MKKTILCIAAICMSLMSVQAKNQLHIICKDSDYYAYGMLTRVSDNSKYAVGADDGFETGSFIVEVASPSDYQHVPGGELYDISNDGTAVGVWYENVGTAEEPINYKRGAYYKDGQWTRLPVVDEISEVGQYYARCISPDGKYIGGMIACKSLESEMGNTYYPALWTLNDLTGNYEVECYSDMQLPGNLGFMVYDMSDDGRTMCGLVYANAGSELPALCIDGELKMFNKVDWKIWHWQSDMYDDYYMTGFVDDVVEGLTEEQWFNGCFNYINGDYVFGHRSIATDIDAEQGTGTITHYRTIYNLKTGEFEDSPSESAYTSGFDDTHAFFTSGMTGYYMHGGKMQTLAKAFGLDVPEGLQLAIIYGHNPEGTVLAGGYVWFNEAIGNYCEGPMLITLDEPLYESSTISAIAPDANAEGIYDLQGRKVTNPAPGIYVKNGKKILIK